MATKEPTERLIRAADDHLEAFRNRQWPSWPGLPVRRTVLVRLSVLAGFGIMAFYGDTLVHGRVGQALAIVGVMGIIVTLPAVFVGRDPSRSVFPVLLPVRGQLPMGNMSDLRPTGRAPASRGKTDRGGARAWIDRLRDRDGGDATPGSRDITVPGPVKGLQRAVLAVSDVQRARSFYEEVLGCRPVDPVADDADVEDGLVLAVGDGRVTLADRPNATPDVVDPDAEPCLAIRATDDHISTVRERLSDQGVQVRDVGAALRFPDPDGNILELTPTTRS